MTKDSVHWLKKQISMAGYTQRGFAKAIGINPSIISHMFRGHRKMQIEEVPVWASALKVPVDALLEKVAAKGPDYVPDDTFAYKLDSKLYQVDEASLYKVVKFVVDSAEEGWLDDPIGELRVFLEQWKIQ